MRARPLLIVGGEDDPNIRSLLAWAEDVPHVALIVGASSHPVLRWDLETLTIDGRVITPRGAFIRHDVFNDGREATNARAYAWWTTLMSYAMATPSVRLLNRDHAGHLLKPQQLVLARSCGLAIPRTLVTNDASLRDDGFVVKPVTGGDYCQPLAPVLASAPRRGKAFAAPAIVQQRLVPPELRIYRVGSRFISFNLVADALDYRTVTDCRVVPARNDARLVAGLRRLTDAMNLDFAAADFKADAESGRMLFLEVNSGPMFAAFDHVSEGAVSRAIIAALHSPSSALRAPSPR